MDFEELEEFANGEPPTETNAAYPASNAASASPRSKPHGSTSLVSGPTVKRTRLRFDESQTEVEVSPSAGRTFPPSFSFPPPKVTSADSDEHTG